MPEAFFLWNSFPEACFVKRQSGSSRSADFGKVANREVPEPALCALNADFVLLSLNISLSMPAEGCFLAIKQNPTFRLCRKCISA